MNISYTFTVLWLRMTHALRKTYKASKCKHKTKRKGVISSGGEIITMSMPLGEANRPEYCLDCVAKMTIRCAWCGSTIFIGDKVTLYTPKDTFKIPDYAVKYTENESKALVGCLRRNCSITGADMCGEWVPPGKVRRFPSPTELVLQTGSTVFVSNMSKYPKSVSFVS